MNPKPTGKKCLSVEPQMSSLLRRRRDGNAEDSVVSLVLNSGRLQLMRALQKCGRRMAQL